MEIAINNHDGKLSSWRMSMIAEKISKRDPTVPKFALDVDGTVFESNSAFRPDEVRYGVRYVALDGVLVPLNPLFETTDDTLINLGDAFGSRQPGSVEPMRRLWDRQCKFPSEFPREQRLTFERHLKLQFEDVLSHISLKQAIEFAIRTLQPKKGILNFFRLFRTALQFAFITNGGDAITDAVLQHFFGQVLDNAFLVYANRLTDGIFEGLHGDVGVAKDRVVLELENVACFAGDSKYGDGPGAQAVWNAGGYVFCLGDDGPNSLTDYCRHHFGSVRWFPIKDYAAIIAIVNMQLSAEQQGRAARMI
jgi:hypothetical protein